MSGMTKCKDENIKVEIAEIKFITPKTKLSKVPKFGKKKHPTSRTATVAVHESRTATVAVLEAFKNASRTTTVAVLEFGWFLAKFGSFDKFALGDIKYHCVFFVFLLHVCLCLCSLL